MDRHGAALVQCLISDWKAKANWHQNCFDALWLQIEDRLLSVVWYNHLSRQKDYYFDCCLRRCNLRHQRKLAQMGAQRNWTATHDWTHVTPTGQTPLMAPPNPATQVGPALVGDQVVVNLSGPVDPAGPAHAVDRVVNFCGPVDPVGPALAVDRVVNFSGPLVPVGPAPAVDRVVNLSGSVDPVGPAPAVDRGANLSGPVAPVGPAPAVDWVVVNLSSHRLTPMEESVLQKGLSFRMASTLVPWASLCSGIEAAAEGLKRTAGEPLVQDFRQTMASLVHRPQLPARNLNNREFNALKSLRGDESICILPADKGNATVILDKVAYAEACFGLLSDSLAYCEAPMPKHYVQQPNGTRKLLPFENWDQSVSPVVKDALDVLIQRQTDALNKLLRNLVSQRQIPHDLQKRLRSSGGVIPRFYILPKIHKNPLSFRPIVSCTGIFCDKTSAFLRDVLSPITGHSDSFIKNSAHFSQKLNSLSATPNDLLVSFDVASLFTKVPVNQTIDIAFQKLSNDPNLDERAMGATVGAIKQLLRFCMDQNLFLFDGKVYQQIGGAPMGSRLSPVLANIYMEWFEETALAGAPAELAPKVWWRFVDDVFCIWKQCQESIPRFLDHLNGIEPQIQFTVELEQNAKHPFLDILITRTATTFALEIYRKKTHTDKYLHFKSRAPLSTKLGVIRTLALRALRVLNGHPKCTQQRTEPFDTGLLPFHQWIPIPSGS